MSKRVFMSFEDDEINRIIIKYWNLRGLYRKRGLKFYFGFMG